MVVLFWFIVIKVMASNEECYIQTTFQLKSCTVKELPSNEAATKATPFIIEHSSGKHSDNSHVQVTGNERIEPDKHSPKHTCRH